MQQFIERDVAPVIAVERTSAPQRVGPNVVIQIGAALRDIVGPSHAHDIYDAAGLIHYLERLPEEMIDQTEAVHLFRAVVLLLGSEGSKAVFRDAGRRTADYILAHRIPLPAQRLLKALPDVVAARALLSAISAHAWTFVGSGVVSTNYISPLQISIARNPLSTPGCPWHVAVFERLFRVLVSPTIDIEHDACCASGGNACLSRIVSSRNRHN